MELAHGDDVEACAGFEECAEDVDVGAAFDGEEDFGVDVAEGGLDFAEVVFDGGAGVDEGGGAEGGGDFGEWEALAAELAVDVGEVVHGQSVALANGQMAKWPNCQIGKWSNEDREVWMNWKERESGVFFGTLG